MGDRGQTRRSASSSGAPSFIQGAPTRVAPTTATADAREQRTPSARGATVSPATTAAPREAWSARANPGGDQGGEPLDEWDFAERGPLAKLKRKQLTEVAREKLKMGIYVDESELGGFKDPRPPHLKPLPNDSDFVGPDSYPRRQRDWIGYYVAGVLCFASFVVGVHGASNGKPEYLANLVDHAGQRPLHTCVYEGRPRCATVLVEAGADPDLPLYLLDFEGG